jgi:hypothetical protein
MTDDEKQPKNVRRVGHKDRKQKLESAGPLFPPRAPEALPAPAAPEPAPEPIEAAAPEPADEMPAAEVRPADDAPTSTADAPMIEERPTAPKAAKAAKASTKAAPLPWRSSETGLPPGGKTAAQLVRKSQWPFTRHDLVALLFLVGTGAVIAFGAAVVRDPYSAINPLPPPTTLPIVVTATFEPTLTPTLTETFTPEPTATFTPLPAALLTSIAPTREASEEATAEASPEATSAA